MQGTLTLGLHSQRAAVNGTLPHKVLGECSLGPTRMAGDTHNLLSAVQESQPCFWNIRNSALYTAVARICHSQHSQIHPAAANAVTSVWG